MHRNVPNGRFSVNGECDDNNESYPLNRMHVRHTTTNNAISGALSSSLYETELRHSSCTKQQYNSQGLFCENDRKCEFIFSRNWILQENVFVCSGKCFGFKLCLTVIRFSVTGRCAISRGTDGRRQTKKNSLTAAMCLCKSQLLAERLEFHARMEWRCGWARNGFPSMIVIQWWHRVINCLSLSFCLKDACSVRCETRNGMSQATFESRLRVVKDEGKLIFSVKPFECAPRQFQSSLISFYFFDNEKLRKENFRRKKNVFQRKYPVQEKFFDRNIILVAFHPRWNGNFIISWKKWWYGV